MPKYVKSRTGGGFNYKPMGVCHGQTARLGLAYRYDNLAAPCVDTRINEEVNKDKYTFQWSGPGTIGNSYNANCNGTNHIFPSRVQIDNARYDEEGTYQIERTHKIIDPSEYKPFDEQVIIIDKAYEHLEVWSFGEEAWLDNCQFLLEATDLSTRELLNESGNLLNNIRKSGNSSNYLKVVRNPVNELTPGGTHEDGVLVEAITVNNNTFAVDNPRWEVNQTNIIGQTSPVSFEIGDPGETIFEIPIEPIPISLPSPIDRTQYNARAIASISEDGIVGNMDREVEVLVFNPEEEAAIYEEGPFYLLNFICDKLIYLKSILQSLGLPVDNCYDLGGNYQLCLSCNMDYSQYSEKWEEIANSIDIIRNRSGYIDFNLKGEGRYDQNVCGALGAAGAFADWLFNCDNIPCIPKFQGRLSVDIPIQFWHDENKWKDISGGLEEFNFSDYESVFDFPIEIKLGIGGSCETPSMLSSIIDDFPTSSDGVPYDITVVKIVYGGHLICNIIPTIDVPQRRHKVLFELKFISHIKIQNKVTGIVLWEGEFPPPELQLILDNRDEDGEIKWVNW